MNCIAPTSTGRHPPGAPEPLWLAPQDHAPIAYVLRLLGWLGDNDVLTGAARAGDGNLNLVLRVESGARTAILKQARPWVEKYPDIPAPLSRSLVEASYYRLVENAPALSGFSPALLGHEPAWHALLLEDLGATGDASSLYAGDTLDAADIDRLMAYLVALHGLRDGAALAPDNAEMLALNHHYIFEQPFGRQGDPGDHEDHSDDADLAGIAKDLGARYLAGKGVLLHGDFFPGAWVRSDRGLCVIDPEFCLIGPLEFELGVMAAHLVMAGAGQSVVQGLAARYAAAGGGVLDLALLSRFAGVEIWRRLCGVAQLPLALDDTGRRALLATSRAMLRA